MKVCGEVANLIIRIISAPAVSMQCQQEGFMVLQTISVKKLHFGQQQRQIF